MSVDKIIKEVAPYLGDQTARIIKATGGAVVEGVKTSTKQASPSKEARMAGENIGVGAIQGISHAAGIIREKTRRKQKAPSPQENAS